MSESIKISVIVPVYNTEPWLRTCLSSLHHQNFQDIEFICVDDGSTDNSLNILKEFADKDKRFVVISQKNGGPAKARNTALKQAKGEYISFVDSDDYMVYGAYSCLYEVAQKNNADIVVFGSYTDPTNAPEWINDILSPRDIIYNNFEPTILFGEKGARPFLWLQLVKHAIIKDNHLLLDESMRLGEDQLFQMAYFPFANKIVFTSEKYYNYRWQRDKSIMAEYKGDKLAKLKTHVVIIDKAFEQAIKFGASDTFKKELLIWSIFFIWGDIINNLAEMQTEIALSLKQVWEKYNCMEFYPQLDCWGQKRMDQILLMAEGGKDYEIKIATYKKAIAELSAEIEEFESSKKYKKIIRRDRIKGLIKKFFASWNQDGLRVAIKKVKKYIIKKLSD